MMIKCCATGPGNVQKADFSLQETRNRGLVRRVEPIQAIPHRQGLIEPEDGCQGIEVVTRHIVQPACKAKDNHWKDIHHCRQFFDEFAREKGFDPQDIEAWYVQNLQQALSKMVGGFI